MIMIIIIRKIIIKKINKKKTTVKSKQLEVIWASRDQISDPAAVLHTSSATIPGMMELNLAHRLLLWRREQCSAGRVNL